MSNEEKAVEKETVLSGIFDQLAIFDHFLLVTKGGTMFGGSKLLNTLNACEVVYEPAYGKFEESFYLSWNDKTYNMNVEQAQKYLWVMRAVAGQYSLMNTQLPHKMMEFLDKQSKG